MRSAFVDIFRTRSVPGLYAGLTPTLVEIVPYAGLQFGTYDTFKRWMRVNLLAPPNYIHYDALVVLLLVCLMRGCACLGHWDYVVFRV